MRVLVLALCLADTVLFTAPRSTGHIVLDGNPAPPPKKNVHSPTPIFGPCLLWPNYNVILWDIRTDRQTYGHADRNISHPYSRRRQNVDG